MPQSPLHPPSRFYATFLIGWLLFIFILCIIPTDGLPKVSWELLEPDKFIHAFLFVIYGHLAVQTYKPLFQKQIIATACYIVSFALIYSFFLETYQHFCTAHRCFELPDILANTFGAMLAVGFYGYKYRHNTL